MGLADLVKEIREDRSKLPGQRLFDYLREQPPRVKQPMKPGGYFRISSLPYLCPREEVLAFQNEIIRVENIPPHLQITFDIGHVFHDLYRDWYFGPMGEWAGAWKCKRCGWDTDAAGLSLPPVKGSHRAKLATMPEKCPECPEIAPEEHEDVNAGMGTITFKEWVVRDKKLRLQGHPDGWRVLPGEDPIIVDLKSHGSNGFIARNTLREGHDIQVWSYQYCSDETDRKGEVYYLNKSPWGDHTAFVRNIVAPFDKKLFDYNVRKPMITLQEGLDGGKLPDRICVSIDAPKAKECQLAEICF